MERQKIKPTRLIARMNLIPENKYDKILLVSAWIIFPAGVLWEYLNWFVWLRAHLAGPLITALTIWGIAILSRNSSTQEQLKFWIICIVVFILGIAAEVAGVATGLVFGEYLYGETLGLKVGGVPIAIGSAWVMMTLFSMASLSNFSKWIQIPGAGILATAFDALMEPAAVRLGYWQWRNETIPIQNYLAWLVLTTLFSWIFSYSKLTKNNPNYLLSHILLIQIIYFILVLIFIH